MGNIFRQELIQQYVTDDYTPTAGIGEYVLRNGLWAMDIRPRPYYDNGNGTWAQTYNNGNARGKPVLEGYFTSSRYVFDLWIDADDVISGDHQYAGGLVVYYTDNTYAYLTVTGDNTNPIGFQHKFLITPTNKTVAHFRVSYSTSMPTFYRADSYICPLDEIKLHQTGVLDTQNITESLTGAKDFEIIQGNISPTEIIEL